DRALAALSLPAAAAGSAGEAAAGWDRLASRIAAESARACARCQAPLGAGEAAAPCPGCLADHHGECLREGGCAAGCAEAPVAPPAAGPRADRSGPRLTVGAGVGLGVALVAALLVAALA